MSHNWVHSAPCAPVPPFAVVGGHDCDGAPIYVGRAFHEGENLPAKVIPSKQSAYVCWSGQEVTKSHYEVLVGHGYSWVPCHGGSVPPHAVFTGTTRGGEPLYVGRGHHANSLTVGKIHPSHGCLYIPFGGQEIRVHSYEVLVQANHEQWVASSPGYVPPGAVVAGHDTDRTPIYVGRAMHEGHEWVHSTAYSQLPDNAVVGGNDSDGDLIYVGRAIHNDDMLVAKVIPRKRIAFVSYRGEELPKDDFEILCGSNLAWRPCHNHVIPENALPCGETSIGQPVYIGRGYYEGSLTVGKVSSVHRTLFIPFKGVERRLESYEVLIEDKSSVGWNIPPATSPASVEFEQNFEKKPPLFGSAEPALMVPLPEMSPPPPPPPALPVFSIKPEESAAQKPPSYSSTAPPLKVPLPGMSTELLPPPPSYSPSQPVYPHIPNVPPESYATPALTYDPPPPYTPAYVPPTVTAVPAATYQPECRDNWVAAHASYMPPNGVHAGTDTDLSALLVCRAFHQGHMLPGKAVPTRYCAYVSCAGQEIVKSHFEVLVGSHYDWVPAYDGNILPGAVEAGHTNTGETLYVGRAHFAGALTPGRIQPSHHCLYIPFGGTERRITHYEMLVRKYDYYNDHCKQMFY